MRISSTLLNAVSKGGSHPPLQAVGGEPGRLISPSPSPQSSGGNSGGMTSASPRSSKSAGPVVDQSSRPNPWASIDRPPLVDFQRPFSRLEALRAEQLRLKGVADDIKSVRADLLRFDREGAENATYAAAWAATLMVADILRRSVSAMDRRASILFSAFDRKVATANKLMRLLGWKTIATREEIMKNVDRNLKPAVDFTKDIQRVRAMLKEYKIRAPKEVDLLLDLGIDITNDSILIMQSGQLVDQIHGRTNHNLSQNALALERINKRIRAVQLEMMHLIEQAQVRMRTA